MEKRCKELVSDNASFLQRNAFIAAVVVLENLLSGDVVSKVLPFVSNTTSLRRNVFIAAGVWLRNRPSTVLPSG